MKEYEFSAKTVEEAIEEGLAALNLTREQAEIAVLEEGKKGGLFSKGVKARVKIGKKMSDGERAVQFLEGLFPLMNVTATAEAEEGEQVHINILTPNSYAVIGHRGEILDAMQVLAGAVANIGRDEYERVVVDCEEYRAKREQTLRRLAGRIAEKAVRTGRKVSLEPMTPYERRIIHSALADNTEVKTTSEGKEPMRYIVVVPNNLRYDRESRYGDRRGYDRRGGYGGYERRGYDRREGGYNRERREDGYNGERRESGYSYDRREGNYERRDNSYDRREGGYNRDRRNGYDRDRRDSRTSAPRPAKRTPYFGTYLGNSGAGKKEEETQAPKEEE